MAMDAGSVTAGGAGSGLAQEMYASLAPKFDFGTPSSSVAQQQIADICNSIAQTVVAHIQANAVVSTSVAASIPVTTAVVADVGTGVTTAPGVGTGTVG